MALGKKTLKKHSEIKKIEINSIESFLKTAENYKPNFTGSIDVDIHFNVQKNSFQGSILLKHPTNSKKSVAIFSENNLKSSLKNVNIGNVQEIKSKKFIPKYIVATKAAFKNIRSAAKILGPRNCFPNQKNGTLVANDEQALQLAEEYGTGQRKNYKTDSMGYIKFSIGQIGMSQEIIKEQLKGIYHHFKESHNKYAIKSMVLSSTTLNRSYKVPINKII